MSTIGLKEPFRLWRWGLDTFYGYEIMFHEEIAQRLYIMTFARSGHRPRGLLLNPRCAIERQANGPRMEN